MASSFLIAYADVPASALTYSSNRTMEEPTYTMENMFYGERYSYSQLSLLSLQTSVEYTFDLGLGNARTLDHFIMGDVHMLISRGVTGAYVQGSPDGSAWTSQLGTTANFQTRTLSGPNGKDCIFTAAFNDQIAGTLTSYRYFKVVLTGGAAHSFPLSKLYFGTFFDAGKEPDYFDVNVISNEAEPWRYPRGNVLMTKSAHARNQVTIEWDGLSDAKADEFLTKILANPVKKHVFLYTATYHDVLFGNRLIHAKVLSDQCSVSKLKQDWNNITAVFEEMV